MPKFLQIAVVLMCTNLLSAQLNRPINTWQDFFAYDEVVAVSSAGTRLIAATPIALFLYSEQDNSIQTFSKVDGLNSSDITALEAFETDQEIYVGYQDGNIDVVDADGSVSNIGDLTRSNIIGDKAINAFKKVNGDIWVCTAVGILVVDPSNFLIKDTYRFGPNGTNINVFDLELLNDTVYAATAVGLYSANLDNPFLANFQNWTRKNVNGSPGQNFNAIEQFSGRLLINYNSGSWPNDVLLESTDLGQSFQLSNFQGEYQCMALRSYGSELLVSDLFSTVLYDQNFNDVERLGGFNDEITFYSDALKMDGKIYRSTLARGVVQQEGAMQQIIKPDGPGSNNTWHVEYQVGTLSLTAGSVNLAHGNNFRREGFSLLRDNESWKNIRFEGDSFGTFYDALSVAIDPLDDKHFFVGTYGTGLLEFQNNQLIRDYNHTNSPIEERPQVPGTTYPNYIEFDANGNLWVINSFATRPIKMLQTDGQWLEFEVDPATGNQNLFTFSSYDITSQNQVWITKFREGVTVVDLGDLSTIEDDQSRFLSTTENQGGLPSGDVKCLVEDQTGAIWGGCDQGIFIYFNPSSIFNNDELNAQQILIEQDGNIQVVLETEQVNDIFVDGGNRKWVATQNSGLFLFSPDGTEQLERFTTNNSPLISNTVLNLGMNMNSGELYVASDKGLQSLQTDATNPLFGEEIALNIYPNPVRKDFTEPIVIEGFGSSSQFTITDANGNLVFRSETNGGRATWNYRNQRNEEVQSGVYFIFAQDDTGMQTRKSKFLLFR